MLLQINLKYMAESYPLFSKLSEKNTSGVAYKSHSLKRRIVALMAENGLMTVSELAAITSVSTPTISKLLNDLIDEGYVQDMGKVETPGGRRPCSFSLVSSAGYFMGVEVGEDCLRFALSDLNRNIIGTSQIDFATRSTPDTIDKIVAQINQAIENFEIKRQALLGVGLILRGRVDSVSGHSYNYGNSDNKPLAEVMSERLGLRTILENDTRAVAYAEHTASNETRDIKNLLFLYVGRGVGVGIIINGELYYGKSGFSGEFGHIPFFENQIICHCGKKGCLETEVSGMALERMFNEALQSGASSILSPKLNEQHHVTMTEIIDAAADDDVLSIEMIGQMGEKLGRGMGVLINIFNPEAVVVGGTLARAGDYLMLPLRSALAKYSLSLVNNDSMLSISTLGDMGAVIGGALLTRNHILRVD